MPPVPMVYLSRWDQHIEVPLAEWHQFLHMAKDAGWSPGSANYEHPHGQLVDEQHALGLAAALEMVLDAMEAGDRLYFAVVDVAEFCTEGEFRIEPD